MRSHQSDNRSIEVICNSNLGERRCRPPAVVQISPLIEPLVQDLRSSVPPALAQRIDRAGTIECLVAWLGVGAAFRSLESRSAAERDSFMQVLGDDPSRLAQAMDAAQQVRRQAQDTAQRCWPLRDRIGLAMQVTLILSVLVGGAVIVTALFVPPAGGRVGGPGMALSLVGNLVGLDLWASLVVGQLSLWRLLLLVGWFGIVEAMTLPVMAEYLRQIVWRDRAAPLASRVDLASVLIWGRAVLMGGASASAACYMAITQIESLGLFTVLVVAILVLLAYAAAAWAAKFITTELGQRPISIA